MDKKMRLLLVAVLAVLLKRQRVRREERTGIIQWWP